MARKSQETLSNIGYFGRFLIVRTEKDQSRAKPFRAYQDPSRIPTFLRPFKQILALFIRTQDTTSSNRYPRYLFTSRQQSSLYRLVRIASEVENLEDFLETLKESSKNQDSSSNEASQMGTSEEDEFYLVETNRIRPHLVCGVLSFSQV